MIPAPEQDDLAQLTDLANAQLSKRDVRWMCPYCQNEVPEEWSLCCHELHAMPMPEGYDED